MLECKPDIFLSHVFDSGTGSKFVNNHDERHWMYNKYNKDILHCFILELKYPNLAYRQKCSHILCRTL